MANDISVSLASIEHNDLIRMLDDICKRSESFRAALQSEIDTHRIKRAGGVEAILIEDSDTDEAAAALPARPNQMVSHKRKHSDSLSAAARVLKKANVKRTADLCGRCGVLFYDDDEDVVCTFHEDKEGYEGSLEQYDEEDFWADHDEKCHGDIDGDFCKMEMPDGYRWDCCNQAGDVKGCSTSTSHR